MNGPNDQWQGDARKRLLKHVMLAPTYGRDYTPDTTYEMLKRKENGPHSLAIGEVLQKWADMWAQDMREITRLDDETPTLESQVAAWRSAMAEADAEIDRYMANNRLTRAA